MIYGLHGYQQTVILRFDVFIRTGGNGVENSPESLVH
jgi:hypothetical protein